MCEYLCSQRSNIILVSCIVYAACPGYCCMIALSNSELWKVISEKNSLCLVQPRPSYDVNEFQ